MLRLRGIVDRALKRLFERQYELIRCKAGYDLLFISNSTALPTDKLSAVKRRDSVASLLKKGSSWIITASGGVQIDAWDLASQTHVGSELEAVKP